MPAPQQIDTLEALIEALKKHRWVFETDTLYDLFQSAQEEANLFKAARHHGLQGILEYIEHQDLAMDERAQSACRLMEDRYVNKLNRLRQYYEAKFKDLRRFMTPLDLFKEKLENHDWYYDFSLDPEIYRTGRDREEQLRIEALNGGMEFQQAFTEAKNAAFNKPENSGG
jgi:hypothetical protein